MLGIIVGHFTGLRRLLRRAGADPSLRSDQRNLASTYAVALAGAMSGYLAAGAFLSTVFFPYLWYLSAMAVALERVIDRERADSRLGEVSRGL
jgi:hypothetical protein